MNVRYGVIQGCEWTPPGEGTPNQRLSELIGEQMINRNLHEATNWTESLRVGSDNLEFGNLITFLNRMLPQS